MAACLLLQLERAIHATKPMSAKIFGVTQQDEVGHAVRQNLVRCFEGTFFSAFGQDNALLVGLGSADELFYELHRICGLYCYCSRDGACVGRPCAANLLKSAWMGGRRSVFFVFVCAFFVGGLRFCTSVNS